MKNTRIDQVAILVGGYGARLKSITSSTPKPLLKFHNKSFLNYLIDFYIDQGVSNVLLLCSYKYNHFKSIYEKSKKYKKYVKCIKQDVPNGNLEALKISYKYLKKDFILCNGDTFINLKIDEIIKYYFNNKRKTICVLTSNKKNISSKSTLLSQKTLNKKMLITKKYRHKYANSGIYIFNKKELKKNKIEDYSSIEKQFLPDLIKKNKIKFYKTNIEFKDIGTPKDFFKTSEFLLKNYPRPCAFLDRDGVINKDYGYVNKISDFKWMPYIRNIIKHLNKKKYLIIVVSNQSGVGRGYYPKKNVKNIENFIKRNLRVDAFYYAYYYKNSQNKNFRKNKFLRKPNIGMFKSANKEFNINLKNSFMVGDNESDKLFARKAGLNFFYFKNNIKKTTARIINFTNRAYSLS